MKRNDYLGRRKYYRIKVAYLVCFRARLPDRGYSNYNYTLTKDVGAGGIFLMSEEKFPRGTQLDMVIRLPMYPDVKVEAKGEVTNNAQVKKGSISLYPLRIRFTELDKHAFKKLNEYIEKEMNKIKNGKTLKERLDRRKG